MRFTQSVGALVLALAILASCGSAKKSYERGDYYDSVIRAVQKLRKNPTNKKSIEALRNGYPAAVETLEREAKNSIATNSRFKYRDALTKYEMINRMHDEIRRSPGAMAIIQNPVYHTSKLNELKNQAAEESYEIAEAHLAAGTRMDAKQAYLLFQEVNNYVPGYKEVNQKLEEAYDMAILHVVVDQIPTPTAYAISADFFQNKVEEHLNRQQTRNEFVQFHTGNSAPEMRDPDQYLRLAFDDFIVGNTLVEKTIKELSRDSVVVGTVTLDDGTKVDAYNTVKATLTVWRKEVLSEGLFSMRVYDGRNNAVLKHDKFNGSFVWFSEWGSFQGDERALDPEHLKICNSQEIPPPPPQQMFIEFTRPIYDDLTRALDSYYAQF